MNKDCRSEKLIKVFYVIFILNISKKISETNYIYILNKLTNVGFKLTSISDVENIIFYLDTLNFRYSYMITMLIYLKNNIFKSITNICNNYTDMRQCAYKTEITNEFDIIMRSKEVMCEKYNIIRSFCKLPSTIKDESLARHGKCKITKNRINTFNVIFSDELINRLFQLRNVFDIDILKYMGVKLIMYKNIKNMNVVDLKKYYLSCVNEIKNKLFEWINLCNIYIDSEVKYIKAIQQIKNTSSFTVIFDENRCDISTTNK